MNENSRYRFSPVEHQDLPLLSVWLNEPLVSRWYTDPDYISDLEDSLKDNRIRMQLVLHDDVPIAYVQDYGIHQWDDHHLGFLPEHSRGIDTFMGSAEFMGKGHGVRYLLLLCTQLFSEGIPALGIDPHPENIRARSAYRKIGFEEQNEMNSEWGKVVLMTQHNPMLQEQTCESIEEF